MQMPPPPEMYHPPLEERGREDVDDGSGAEKEERGEAIAARDSGRVGSPPKVGDEPVSA